MPAKYVVLGVLICLVVFGGVAAALHFGAGPSARGSGTVAEDGANSSSPGVNAGRRDEHTHPSEDGLPVAGKDARTTDEEDSETNKRRKLLGQLAADLGQMKYKQAALCDATQVLASKLDDQGNQWQEGTLAELKTLSEGQADVQKLAGLVLGALKKSQLPNLAADMEQVQRMLVAIMGNLCAREPDVSYTTQVMQAGVTQKLGKILASVGAERDSLLTVQEVPATDARSALSVTVRTDHAAVIDGDRTLASLTIEPGAKLSFSGTLTVTGDFRNEGTLEAQEGTLVMGGGDQNFSGEASVQRVRFSGGTKHLTAGSNLTTVFGEVSGKDDPILVVEAGTTLVIDKDARVSSQNPFGVRVAGTLIIDGGVFHCSFTCGDGLDPVTDGNAANGKNKSWVMGSQLIVKSGSFIGDGDASFSGASVYVQGGELRINDDIWSSGDLLEISGGVMSNDSGGGQFNLTGQVRISGGRLEINQYEGRGMNVGKDATIWSQNGEVVIGGQDVEEASSGIVLAHNVMLPNLQVTRTTFISTNTEDAITLSVSGNISIDKDKKLIAQGRRVLGRVETGEDHGELEP